MPSRAWRRLYQSSSSESASGHLPTGQRVQDSQILILSDFTKGFCDQVRAQVLVTGLKSRCWLPVRRSLAARGGATRRRKARGDSLDTQGSLQLHKIIIRNVSNDPGAIRSAHDRFATLYFLAPSGNASERDIRFEDQYTARNNVCIE